MRISSKGADGEFQHLLAQPRGPPALHTTPAHSQLYILRDLCPEVRQTP